MGYKYLKTSPTAFLSHLSRKQLELDQQGGSRKIEERVSLQELRGYSEEDYGKDFLEVFNQTAKQTNCKLMGDN